MGADNKTQRRSRGTGGLAVRRCLLNATSVSPLFQRLYCRAPIRYARRKMPLIFSNARKCHSHPIEIISGNEEARLIFMGGVRYAAGKGRKLRSISAAGQQSWPLAKTEPCWLKAVVWAAWSFAQLYLLAALSIKKTSSAPEWRRRKTGEKP
ncbi:hypothetical protein KCP74_12660 [Salmonella enterica subsp. enterica]|nr:hypothetical protein KCP74_12660 [Salmonella enterica subsp. enterica]